MPHRAPKRNSRRVPNALAPLTPLNWQQTRFVESYLVSLDATDAALAADYTNAENAGRHLLQHPTVRKAIAQAQSRRSSRVEIYADDILKRWWLLATADVNELVQLRIVNCRYCHGEDFNYQFTKNEFETAKREHELKQRYANDEERLAFDPKGGVGFRKDLPPNPDCTECWGEGERHVIFRDTRTLSVAGRMLYDGVEVSANGAIKLKMRDRAGAELLAARHLGMLIDREPIKTLDPRKMSDADLEAAIDSLPDELRRAAAVLIEGKAQQPLDAAEAEPDESDTDTDESEPDYSRAD